MTYKNCEFIFVLSEYTFIIISLPEIVNSFSKISFQKILEAGFAWISHDVLVLFR